MNNETLQEVISIIKKGRIEEGIDKLEQFFHDGFGSIADIKRIAFLKTRHSALQRKFSQGFISSENHSVEQNKIVQEIISIVHNFQFVPEPSRNYSKLFKTLILLFLISILGFLSYKFIFSGHIETFETLKGECKIRFDKNASLKVLVFPFKSYDACDGNLPCEQAYLEGLEGFSSEVDVKIDYETVQNVNDQENQARLIARDCGADIVLWGNYEKIRCDWDTTKINLRYLIMNDSNLFLPRNSNVENEFSTSNLSDISNGVISGNITEIIHWSLGYQEVMCGNYQKAVEHFLKIEITDKMEYLPVIVLLGASYTMLEKYNRAITYYQKALKFDSLQYSIYYNIGVALSFLDRFEEAIKNYDKAIEINPDFFCPMVQEVLFMPK